MFTMDMKFYTCSRIPKHGEMSMLSCSSVNIMIAIIGYADFVVTSSLYCWYLSTVKLTHYKAFNVIIIIMAAKRLKDNNKKATINYSKKHMFSGLVLLFKFSIGLRPYRRSAMSADSLNRIVKIDISMCM